MMWHAYRKTRVRDRETVMRLTERSMELVSDTRQGNRRSHFARAVHSHHSRQRQNGPFCWCITLFATNALQWLSMGRKSHKIPPSPWDFVTLPEEDRDTAIGNMHENLVKIAPVLAEISCQIDRQTHRQTGRRYWSQYFTTAPAGEVTKHIERNDQLFVTRMM